MLNKAPLSLFCLWLNVFVDYSISEFILGNNGFYLKTSVSAVEIFISNDVVDVLTKPLGMPGSVVTAQKGCKY